MQVCDGRGGVRREVGRWRRCRGGGGVCNTSEEEFEVIMGDHRERIEIESTGK